MKVSKTEHLDNQITKALRCVDIPPAQLNEELKRKLYEQETALMQVPYANISLWYVPMVVNAIVCLILNVLAQILISTTLFLQVINIVCVYQILIGVVLTFIGLKFNSLKDTLVWHKREGDAIAWKIKVKNIF